MIFALGYVIIGLLLFLLRAKQANHMVKGSENSISFTVIIPFRNEAQHLPRIIQCIEKQTLSVNIIFVNDHSTDESKQFLSNLGVNFKSIENEGEGKKSAILSALPFVETEYFLTLDADVYFDEHFFKAVSQLPENDLSILPVFMTSTNIIGAFGTYEYARLQTVNFIASALKRPIMASGANLLVRKKTFEDLCPFEHNLNYLSGDDQFTLKAMYVNDKKIHLVHTRSCAVKTEAPQQLKPLLAQRKRWISKSHKVNDGFANGLGMTLLLIQIAYFASVIHSIFHVNLWTFCILIGAKIIVDYLVFSYELKRYASKTLFLYWPIFEWLYPLFGFTLILSLFSNKGTWKKRALNTKIE